MTTISALEARADAAREKLIASPVAGYSSLMEWRLAWLDGYYQGDLDGVKRARQLELELRTAADQRYIDDEPRLRAVLESHLTADRLLASGDLEPSTLRGAVERMQPAVENMRRSSSDPTEGQMPEITKVVLRAVVYLTYTDEPGNDTIQGVQTLYDAERDIEMALRKRDGNGRTPLKYEVDSIDVVDAEYMDELEAFGRAQG